MYAFLLRNWMHFSKHQMQHWRILNTKTMTLFFCASACFSKYFIRYRMNCTKATMKEPKATEPTWYLKTLQIDFLMVPPIKVFSECGLKNQMQVAMAIKIWPRAMEK